MTNLEAAAWTMLRPIIKFMLTRDIDLGTFTSIAKAVYVDVAQDNEFAIQSDAGKKKRITASRVSLITGINRKEVKRLIDNGYTRPVKSYTNRAVRVVTGWVSDERFHDDRGEPAELSYGVDDASNSFERLVKQYSGDMTPRVILDELVRVGAVDVSKPETVTLVDKGYGYIPTKSEKQLLDISSKAIGDLASTVFFNLSKTETEKPLLQRTVYYDDVAIEGAALFKNIITKDANDFLKQQNKILSSLDRSHNPDIEGSGRYRIGVGIYYFEEDTNE